ncbi:MAG: inorganic phosphate transporter [Nitrososphaerota archaeon]|nr:inorganic phosphate transporter [Nitrososphaerota archaeon]
MSVIHLLFPSIIGAGATRRKHAVRWKMCRQIVTAWLITIPGSAAIAFVSTTLINWIVGA